MDASTETTPFDQKGKITEWKGAYEREAPVRLGASVQFTKSTAGLDSTTTKGNIIRDTQCAGHESSLDWTVLPSVRGPVPNVLDQSCSILEIEHDRILPELLADGSQPVMSGRRMNGDSLEGREDACGGQRVVVAETPSEKKVMCGESLDRISRRMVFC